MQKNWLIATDLRRFQKTCSLVNGESKLQMPERQQDQFHKLPKKGSVGLLLARTFPTQFSFSLIFEK